MKMKKFLSILLTALMLFSAVPLTAPAYGGVLNLYDDTDSGSIIGGAGLEDCGGAIYAAEATFV